MSAKLTRSRPRSHARATPLAEIDEEPMVGHLERDQLVAATLQPVPRARLSRRVQLTLWLLRVFVVLVSAMVIYTFIARL
jgi:hypothetical protein